MAAKTILNKHQQVLLQAIEQDKKICKLFYLTGGTALAEFYLRHRLSEDLDFFSEEEFTTQQIFNFLKKIQKQTGITKIDHQQSFNRNLFFLYFNRDVVKIEFTYFPFPRIEKKLKCGNLSIDSLLDIAVNKLFAIYQKPRSRDFIDLYLIVQKNQWSIPDLIKKAKIKFDWHVDALQLGAQFFEATKVKDFPRMIKKIENKEWQKFFVKEAKMLKDKIFE